MGGGQKFASLACGNFKSFKVVFIRLIQNSVCAFLFFECLHFYSCEKSISWKKNPVLPRNAIYNTLSNFRSIICQMLTPRRLKN